MRKLVKDKSRQYEMYLRTKSIHDKIECTVVGEIGK